MSREIKFRGKRMDNGEWVFGGVFVNGLHAKIITGGRSSADRDGEMVSAVPVIPITVGQYWEPSLGIEMYTGDLFTAIASPTGESVAKEMLCKCYNTGSGMSAAVYHKGEWWAYGSMKWNTAKVIGNIFDNEDLIK